MFNLFQNQAAAHLSSHGASKQTGKSKILIKLRQQYHLSSVLVTHKVIFWLKKPVFHLKKIIVCAMKLEPT